MLHLLEKQLCNVCFIRMSRGLIASGVNSKTNFSQPPVPVTMAFTYKGGNHGLDGSVDSLCEICLRMVAGGELSCYSPSLTQILHQLA